ncbi:hypothetical protein POM88_053501 [Heracleum sosnowskyi]|uniref:Uncharacterized protein n=1 Tax=Heracleum sosnowskyi TaxID=360622 RepID=A0AAD8GNS2_9APIA|nr:hypothetical protein POM88_053501 [Heracleum sosnowskyi]
MAWCWRDGRDNAFIKTSLVWKDFTYLEFLGFLIAWRMENVDGVYFFLQDDIELLDWLKESRPSLRNRYFKVDADKVTVEKCLELLKGIDCESRFLACSVEEPSFFFALLNEDDATRLKASDGISGIYRRPRLMFLGH